MTVQLFCYGTLCHAPIMRAVLGTLPTSCPACLSGYACVALAGEPYPALVPRRESQVQGLVYLGLHPALLRRLDNYEGELYRRVRVHPVLADGRQLEAWIYILGMRFYHRRQRRQWSMPQFLRRHAKACRRRL